MRKWSIAHARYRYTSPPLRKLQEVMKSLYMYVYGTCSTPYRLIVCTEGKGYISISSK